MMWETHISPLARNDVDEVFEWYETKVRGLGLDFLEHVELSLQRMQETPLSYTVVLDDLRRVPLTRFPYGIYYRVADERLEVIAVYHASRDLMRLRTRK